MEEYDHGAGLGVETFVLRKEGRPWVWTDWMGADGHYVENAFLFGTVRDNVLSWTDFFEGTASELENMGSATGLAVSRDFACPACFFITDGPGEAIKNYLNGDV